MLLAAWTWWPAIWPRDVIAQSYDSNWHGYVVAIIQNLNTGAPWRLVPIDPLLPAVTEYYPTGMHLVMALAAFRSESVAPAVNAIEFLLAVVVTPLGIAALAREVVPRLRLAAALAPGLAVVATSFEARNTWIPSYDAAVSLIPAVLALLIHLQRKGWPLRLGAIATLAPMALYATQPAGAVTAAILAGLALLEGLVRRSSGLTRPREIARIAYWTLAAGVVIAPWALASLAAAADVAAVVRPVYTTVQGGLFDLAMLNSSNPEVHAPSVLLLPVLAGWLGLAWLALRGRTVWPLASASIFGALFVIAAGYDGHVRRVLTVVWVTDWYRIMPAVTLLVALGLAAGAALLLARAGTPGLGWVGATRIEDDEPAPAQVRATAAGLVVGLLVIAWVTLQQPASNDYVTSSRRPTVVTPGEVAAFAWLDRRVSASERVLNDWLQGTEWMYATNDVVPFEPYGITARTQPERNQLLRDFARLGEDPTVLRRIRAYKIRYVIYSASALKSRVNLRLPPGGQGLELVFRQGDASVYRIDGTR